jgi:hypothetical protein
VALTEIQKAALLKTAREKWPIKLNDKFLLRSSSDKIAKTYIDESDKSAPPQNCPWVEIGCIFASITFTGESSWVSLLQLLRERGRKQFVIYTGRHGDIVNKVDKDRKSFGILDHEHYVQDSDYLECGILREKLPDVGIQLVDVSKWETDHTAKLKADTSQHFDRGVGIIYAWCHSLFTFREMQMEALDCKLAEVWPKLVFNSYHQVRAPDRTTKIIKETKTGLVEWNRPNKDFKEQDTAYRKAKAVQEEIEKRDVGDRVNGLWPKESNQSISKLVFKYWKWVPAMVPRL